MVPMNFLVIDTSSPQSFVALCKEGVLSTIPLPPLKQSQSLLPAIEKLVENGPPLTFIAIGTGPGSFTGTRVGVMAAKALSFSLKVPLLPFCSLKIFTPSTDGPFALIGDAKSRGSYILEGVKDGENITYFIPKIGEKKAPSTSLNLPFLKAFLQDKFHQNGGSSHKEVAISYLTSC